jgi:hypothetical protein
MENNEMSKKLSFLIPDKQGNGNTVDNSNLIQEVDNANCIIDRNMKIDGDISANNIILNFPLINEFTFSSSNLNSQGGGSDFPDIDNNDSVLIFSRKKINEIGGSLKLPLNWKEGSEIKINLNLLMDENGNDSDYSKWRFNYRWSNLNTVIDSSFTENFQLINMNYSKDYYFTINNFIISGLNKSVGSMFNWKLARMAKDNDDSYNKDIKLFSVSFMIYIDKFGVEDVN